ncbi:MAG: ribosome maturation factor RimM [Pseudomonadota bacterium]|uniref:Ribosome maturation factor RimM n=1 Tax=Methylophaga aminisulfidivorans MP TaxID=1026882 RepID=F5SV13_9GAMM|nr:MULTISPECIES: ribosome maturation factor RimM [Methylophaga]EGL56073.1 RimM protein, required for 16S rRNA processing [Methylophaga aminisulfidivorans MP]MEC9411531.1 ribosome maturation factor RimM [Pseudomonadota bacterium]WVI86084.1 ribosome maturation factor RimM [Methylophaga thalassica]
MSTSEEFIPVGKISGAFGVKGWVKVYSFTEPRTNILQYSPLFLSRRGDWIEIKVSGGRLQGKGVVMGIENVTDRDQVQPLVGADLAIKKSQLEPVDEDEFYWNDLEGLTVINLQNQVLGKVDHLLETGANDVLVVKADGKKAEILIPFVVDEIVKLVDLDEEIIQVDWSEDY